jgi:MFS family permease
MRVSSVSLVTVMRMLASSHRIFAPRQSFYGWRMVVFASIALALTGPGQTAGLSVFVDPLINDLDITRTQLTAAYMIGTLVGAMALPWIGRGIDAYGVRKAMAVIGLVFGASLLGLSLVSGLPGLTVGFVLLRMAGQGALALAATTVVASWFVRRRGLALGIVGAAGSLGITLTPLAANALIAQFGWRQAWQIEGVVVLAVVVPLAVLAIRNRPADIGQFPDGEPVHNPSDAVPAGATVKQARATLFFWVILGAVALNAGLATAVGFHQISILTERGLSPAAAAANFIPQAIAALLAMLLVGALSDRISSRWLITASMVSLSAGVAWAAFVTPGYTALGFAVLIGASAGATRVLETAEVPRHFGLVHLGAIRGWITGVAVGASALGPVVFSIGQAITGNFSAVLLASASLPAIVLVSALFLGDDRPRQSGDVEL